MQGVKQLESGLYAVIQTIYSNGYSERFVVAYATAGSLRDFIAPERIVAFGFHSRNEAKEFAEHTAVKTHSTLLCGIARRWHQDRLSFTWLGSAIAALRSAK